MRTGFLLALFWARRNVIVGPETGIVAASLSFSDTNVGVVPALALVAKYGYGTMDDVTNFLYEDNTSESGGAGTYEKGATLLERFMQRLLTPTAPAGKPDAALWMRFFDERNYPKYDIKVSFPYELEGSTCELFPWKTFSNTFFTAKTHLKKNKIETTYTALDPNAAGIAYGEYLFHELLSPATSCVAVTAKPGEVGQIIKRLVDGLFQNEGALHHTLHRAAETLAYSMGYHGKSKKNTMFHATLDCLKRMTSDNDIVRHVFFGIYFETDPKQDSGIKVKTAKYGSIANPLVRIIKEARSPPNEPGKSCHAQRVYEEAIEHIDTKHEIQYVKTMARE